jgi:hypothetical protein
MPFLAVLPKVHTSIISLTFNTGIMRPNLRRASRN